MPGYFGPLDGHNYMSLKTFRKNGDGVATPVWFAENDGRVYVITQGDSGKVKRIRNTGAVEIAPCDVRGGLKGEYFAAQANITEMGTPGASIGRRVLMQKYGWLLRGMFLLYRLRGKQEDFVILEVLPREGEPISADAAEETA